MRLFIIGNGFDKAHGLKTSYSDFRQFLKKNHNYDAKDIPNIIHKLLVNQEKNLKNEITTMIVYIITESLQQEGKSDDWSELEKTLGELNYASVFELYKKQMKFTEDKYMEEVELNERIAELLSDVVPQIQDFISEWIDTIEVENNLKKESIFKLFEPDSQFLSFNYTDTLEKVYGIPHKNICYIHGKKGQTLLFGHGNEKRKIKEVYLLDYMGAEEAIELTHHFLFKDTENNLRNSMDFFSNLDEQITEVYVFGFSFGDVDDCYIDDICHSIAQDAIWYFNDYESEEKIIKYIKKIKLFTSNGKNKCFHVL